MSRTVLLPAAGVVLGLLLINGCGGGGSSSNAVSVGPWGNESQQAQLTVASTGATFGGGLGSGVISKRLTIDGSGHFDVVGTFGGQEGGAPPVPPVPLPVFDPARYTGTVNGKTMTVTVAVTPSDGQAYTEGPFTLTYGQMVTFIPPP